MRAPELYQKRPRCAAGCGRLWKAWHRDCNLVYCKRCVLSHACPRTPAVTVPAQAQTQAETPLLDAAPAPANGQGNGHPAPPGRGKLRT